jgi:Pyruvate phosphate dikinase, AMP/ATP-binding domain/Cyclic nucleotide-binding domain
MKSAVPLAGADNEAIFGAKATDLGEAVRAGLPVPPGIALAGELTEAVAAGQQTAIGEVMESARFLTGPLAVRSSAVGEDSADASFAGQHLTLLNVPSCADLSTAIRQIWWSANTDSVITYRKRVGLFDRPSVGVVVQSLLNPEVAGVMFTQNPVNGTDERVIEASWGLGEAVVAARVIPDHFRLDRSGEVLERTPGFKKIAIRAVPTGGTVERELAPELVEALCLDDRQLHLLNALAARCEQVYGPARDVEWAYADDQIYLLQCRAVTHRRQSPPSRALPGGPAEVIGQVPFFTGLSDRDKTQIASMFKERTFAAGETIIKEGVGAAAFFVIESGEATVSIRGKPIRKLARGDYFGEIALIDEGTRSATVTASAEVVCHGLTYWEFRPLVQANATIAWNLLQTLAKRLRTAQDV